MATQPGTYNITLQRRADYSIELEFRDSTYKLLNLTGWVVLAQAWDPSRTTKHADFAIDYLDRLNGVVRLRLTHGQTATLPTECCYDVLLIDPSGFREYYMEGSITASEGYTG